MRKITLLIFTPLFLSFGNTHPPDFINEVSVKITGKTLFIQSNNSCIPLPGVKITIESEEGYFISKKDGSFELYFNLKKTTRRKKIFFNIKGYGSMQTVYVNTGKAYSSIELEPIHFLKYYDTSKMIEVFPKKEMGSGELFKIDEISYNKIEGEKLTSQLTPKGKKQKQWYFVNYNLAGREDDYGIRGWVYQ